MHEYLSAGGAVVGGGRDHTLLQQGLLMRDAMAADLLRIPGVEVHCAGLEGLPAPTGARPLAAREGESPLQALERHAQTCDSVWGVAPETDRLLQQLQAAVGAARWIGCSAEAIAVASSKQATIERLAAAGLPTPPDFAPRARQWVVKPDDGAGATDARVHARRSAAQADRDERERLGRPATLEPWVEGEPLSLSLLCSAGEAEVLSVNRQHLEVDGGGQLLYRGVEIQALAARDARRPALRRLASAVAAALPGLRGFVGIDLVWHRRAGPVPIEVNPRVTCAYVGMSRRLGRNLAAEVLALHRETLDAAA